MNRREFVKALAGIPLLGLLVKAPSTSGPSIGDAIEEIVKREGWGPAISYVDGNVYGETALLLFRRADLLIDDYWVHREFLRFDTNREIEVNTQILA